MKCKRNLQFRFLLFVFSNLLLFGEATASDENLWDFLQNVANGPANEMTLEMKSNANLKQVDDATWGQRWEGNGLSLADGTNIEKIVLLKYLNGQPARVIVGFGVSGRCFKLSEIEKRFGNVRLLLVPLHGNPDEALMYDVRDFSRTRQFFLNASTRCLSYVKILFNPSPLNPNGL